MPLFSYSGGVKLDFLSSTIDDNSLCSIMFRNKSSLSNESELTCRHGLHLISLWSLLLWLSQSWPLPLYIYFLPLQLLFLLHYDEEDAK